GPDLISDMTTRIIVPDLAAFTERVLHDTSISTQRFKFEEHSFDLPTNPFSEAAMPIVLVPKDVLSCLPTASDWSEVAHAAAENAALRHRVISTSVIFGKGRREKIRLCFAPTSCAAAVALKLY